MIVPACSDCRGELETGTAADHHSWCRYSAKPCQDCGYPFTQPAGACSLCPECGSSSGCS